MQYNSKIKLGRGFTLEELKVTNTTEACCAISYKVLDGHEAFTISSINITTVIRRLASIENLPQLSELLLTTEGPTNLLNL